ncbi:MAG: MarR family transcriptional regulator [Candidatus Thorarchaeota archaeon]|nr:MarR family transcriptional regulator [Candidatus Thorarchaeota archaeon]
MTLSADRDLLKVLAGFMNQDRDTLVPARLSILVYLYFTGSARFSKLQEKLELTSGNLASHLKKLEELNFIRTTRGFIDVIPVRFIEITPAGVAKVREQIGRMRDLVSKVVEE